MAALTALILGDIIGAPGCRAVLTSLKSLIRKYSAQMVVVNGENAAEGFGITEETAISLLSTGAHVITTGNHVWQERGIYEYLDQEERILRPANYPGAAPGHGYHIANVRGTPIGVINLQGRTRMSSIDCPFRKARDIVKKIKSQCSGIIVDFHAESTDEKEALGLYLDGDVSVLFGTHTHVQTADERILPRGTGYITDVGAAAPSSSVIGFNSDISVKRSLTQVPIRNVVADTPATIHGIVVDIDPDSGKSLSIRRIQEESLI